ncbi:hypothetical protein LLS04_04980 [Erysipelothrix enhydrae]|uniref:hypothetical protein n=1 Tax=Erysipelothrix enhydrae TaxID=2890314 RepID=UPI002B24B7BA|nr:hypothetical protein [Erysipelothrix sp. 4322-04]WRB86335.1 hypothetical protein LLS04_04980 [Erysipelothrix sp. 4322-04]
MDGAMHVSGMQIAMMVVSFVFIIAMMVVLLGRYRRDEDLSRTLIWGLVIFMGTNAIVNGFGVVLNKTSWFLSLPQLAQLLLFTVVVALSFVIISFFVMKAFVKKHLNENTPIMMVLGFMLMNVFQTAMSLMNYIMLSLAINKGDTAKFIGDNTNPEMVQNAIDSVLGIQPIGYLDVSVSVLADFIAYATVLIILYRLFTSRKDRGISYAIIAVGILVSYRLVIEFAKYQIASPLLLIAIKLVVSSLVGYTGYIFYKKDF